MIIPFGVTSFSVILKPKTQNSKPNNDNNASPSTLMVHFEVEFTSSYGNKNAVRKDSLTMSFDYFRKFRS